MLLTSKKQSTSNIYVGTLITIIFYPHFDHNIIQWYLNSFCNSTVLLNSGWRYPNVQKAEQLCHRNNIKVLTLKLIKVHVCYFKIIILGESWNDIAKRLFFIFKFEKKKKQ